MMRFKLYRAFALTSAFALFNMCVPYGAVAEVGIPLRHKMEALIAARAAAEKSKAVSRKLSPKEQKAMQGRTGTCPYLAGATSGYSATTASTS